MTWLNNRLRPTCIARLLIELKIIFLSELTQIETKEPSHVYGADTEQNKTFIRNHLGRPERKNSAIAYQKTSAPIFLDHDGPSGIAGPGTRKDDGVGS